MVRDRPRTTAEFIARYPRLTAHVIADSLGSCTPSTAAMVILDANCGNPNRSEWVRVCYSYDPVKALENAIRTRHHHHGEMVDYKLAKAIVDRALRTGYEPLFQSWPEMDSEEWAERAVAAYSADEQQPDLR